MADLQLDIIEHLESKMIVAGDGIDSFRDFMPEKPVDVVSIVEYAGSATPLQEEALHRSFQITVRNKKASSAKTLANTIFKELSPLDRSKMLKGVRWCQLYPRQSPYKLKVDKDGNSYYVFNIGVTANRD